MKNRYLEVSLKGISVYEWGINPTSLQSVLKFHLEMHVISSKKLTL